MFKNNNKAGFDGIIPTEKKSRIIILDKNR
jgi:hypothetical protein